MVLAARGTKSTSARIEQTDTKKSVTLRDLIESLLSKTSLFDIKKEQCIIRNCAECLSKKKLEGSRRKSLVYMYFIGQRWLYKRALPVCLFFIGIWQ